MPGIYDHLRKYLLKNSMMILTASVMNAFFGFLFWWVAAAFYQAADVGLATAMISSYSLLIIVTRFGLEYSMIRFSNSGDFSRILSSTTAISTLTILAASVLFIAGIEVFSPNLSFLRSGENFVLFVSMALVGSMQWMTSSSFLALKKLKAYLFQTLLLGLRVPLLMAFIALGAIGIFFSQFLAFAAVLAVSLAILYALGVKMSIKVDWGFIRESLRFSAGNYVSSMFFAATPLILPIFAVNILGAEQAAYYFIAYYIAVILLLIPNAITTSLFVEGSHGSDLRKTTRESVKDIYLLLVPASIILFLLGEPLLRIIGPAYSSAGLTLFQIMIVSNLIACPCYLFFAVARVRKNIGALVLVASVIFSVLIVSSYAFAVMYGLVGFGYSWVLSYVVGDLLIAAIVLLGRKRAQPIGATNPH